MYKITFFTFFWLFLLNYSVYSQLKTYENTKIIYLSPVPNSQMNSPMTNIIIRTNNLLNQQTINANELIVKGSESGFHTGDLILSDDGKTLIFNLARKFKAGENINVNINQGIEDITGNSIGKYNFNFSISKYILNTHKRLEPFFNKEIKSASMQKTATYGNYNTKEMKKVNTDSLRLPADFPELYISVLSNPSPGYIFLSNFDASSFNSSSELTTM